MKEYSKVYKIGRRLFRYNYNESVLEYVVKETAKKRKENEDWLKEGFTEPLWNFVNGYDVMDSIGLNRENWEASPRSWCEQYNDELEEEFSYQTYMFEKYEMPYYI